MCRDQEIGVEVDALRVELRQMHVETVGGELHNHGRIVQQTDWLVKWDRPLGSAERRAGTMVPDMKVEVALSSAGATVDLTERQYALVCAVWTGNLAQQWVRLEQAGGWSASVVCGVLRGC